MNMDKVAIITAASRGMGAACANELAHRGYRVAIMSRSQAVVELAAELGGVGMTGSVTSADDLSALVDLTMNEFGRIDAVVNNTGHPPRGPLLEISDEDWHQGLDLVMLNVVRMSRIITPIMKKQQGGAIVNISTFAAFEPSSTFPVSATLRAALGGYTKLFADQFASHGIRMNSVLPGFIDSYSTDETIQATIPMGRYGKVSEIAQTVAFLLSSDAAYITGQNIRVDGGLTRSI